MISLLYLPFAGLLAFHWSLTFCKFPSAFCMRSISSSHHLSFSKVNSFIPYLPFSSSLSLLHEEFYFQSTYLLQVPPAFCMGILLSRTFCKSLLPFSRKNYFILYFSFCKSSPPLARGTSVISFCIRGCICYSFSLHKYS